MTFHNTADEVMNIVCATFATKIVTRIRKNFFLRSINC